MTDHAIPPRELVEQWASEKCYDDRDWLYELHIANRAAQWGADIELKACCKWLEAYDYDEVGRQLAEVMHAARRPRPPSLKEQALEALDRMDQFPNLEDRQIVRHALEQLDD
jgi:hypothetical protein